VLLIPVKYRPVIHSGTDLVVVTESGTVLTINAGYDGTSDVILIGANEPQRCEMVRPYSTWLRGYGNVKVVMAHGHATVPADVVQLATEVATLIFNAGLQVGKSSKSVRGGSMTFAKDLTPQSQTLLDEMKDGIW
jgi:hypothetical protein